MKKSLKDRIKPFLNEAIDSNSVLQAIRGKQKVRIKYDDTKADNGSGAKGSRVILPMAIGTTKKGYPVLRAYQEGGGSRRGIPKWKFFRLDRITSWQPYKKKRFFDAPQGYNYNGDNSMGTFIDNAKFDDFVSPLERERQQFANAAKVGWQKNTQGPIQQPKITQQRRNNVYTSQPNSQKYDMIKKNIEATPKKDEDFWKLFDLNDAENTLTQNQKGPIDNNNNDTSYDSDEIDFDENDWTNKQ